MLQPKTLENISNVIESTYGITYEEYSKLDYDEQQRLVRKNRKKRESGKVTIMIGSGEYSTFIKVKKGKLVLIGSGEHSCFVRAGVSPLEEERELDDKLDDIIYSKPVAFIKKLKRRFNK